MGFTSDLLAKMAIASDRGEQLTLNALDVECLAFYISLPEAVPEALRQDAADSWVSRKARMTGAPSQPKAPSHLELHAQFWGYIVKAVHEVDAQRRPGPGMADDDVLDVVIGLIRKQGKKAKEVRKASCPATVPTESHELACGNCGCAEHRLREERENGHLLGVQTVCAGCGCVSHVRPSRPSLNIAWGDESQGEKADGVLCRMKWRQS